MKAADIFSNEYYDAYNFVTDYTCERILKILHGALHFTAEKGFSMEEAIQAFSCKPEFIPSLQWAIDFLVQEKKIEGDDDFFYRILDAGNVSIQQHYHVETLSSLKLIDFVADNWVDVLSGRVSPVKLFFGTEGSVLWRNYFSNENGLYRVHNVWLAHYLKDLLKPASKLLELGAGFGSATEQVTTIIEKLNIYDYTYFASDVSMVMLRDIRNKLEDKRIQTVIVDFNKDINEEKINQKFDLVIAVNALHCAVNLEDSLLKIKKIIAPNGYLVLSECTRQCSTSLLHQEFIFNLLPGYRKKKEDSYKVKGFLTTDEWRKSLLNTQYKDVEIVSNDGSQMLASIIKGRVA